MIFINPNVLLKFGARLLYQSPMLKTALNFQQTELFKMTETQIYKIWNCESFEQFLGRLTKNLCVLRSDIGFEFSKR